jgi:transposase
VDTVGPAHLATGALTLLFGSKETSDFWADGLMRGWESVKGGLRPIRRLVVSPDNGPNAAGTRTPWLKRVVEFADATGLEVRLVYDPPYHSKSNPVERCWSALEQKWGGGQLTCLEVILGYARRMRWHGRPPTVGVLAGEYAAGVRLSKAQMKPVEARLERSKTLPKYDILIRPKAPIGR